MNLHEPFATFGQDLGVALGLSIFQHAKAVDLAGNGDIRAVVSRELEKDSGVRPAFVQLAG